MFHIRKSESNTFTKHLCTNIRKLIFSQWVARLWNSKYSFKNFLVRSPNFVDHFYEYDCHEGLLACKLQWTDGKEKTFKRQRFKRAGRWARYSSTTTNRRLVKLVVSNKLQRQVVKIPPHPRIPGPNTYPSLHLREND